MAKGKRENREPAPPQSEQSRRFIEAARELGCDEDESAFDEIVKKVAKAPTSKHEKPKRRKGG